MTIHLLHSRSAPGRNSLALTPNLLALCAAALVAGCAGGDGPALPVLEIKTLSNRADLVSDGDALVQVLLPAGATAEGLKVEVNGVDISAAFATRSDGRITGLVSGMKVGENLVSASTNSAAAAVLTVTNHDRGGPVYSGAQPTPFVCATPTPLGTTGTVPATNASGLGTAATDAKCNIATETKLYYRTTTAGCSFALPDPSPSVPFTAAASAR